MKTKNLFLTICIATFSFTLMPLYSLAQAPSYVWAKAAGGNAYDEAKSVTTDILGNSYVVGIFNSPTINFGSTTLTNTGTSSSNMFIVKYDASGNTLWAKNLSGINTANFVISVTTDASGNVYMVGVFNSPTINFGSITLTNSGTNLTTDIFIVKYDTNGNVVWAKSAGGNLSESAKGVTDALGNSYMVGGFNSPTITFGSATLTHTGGSSYDMFIVKYDSNGNYLWAKNAGTNVGGEYIAVDASDNVYVTGTFSTPTITFGSTTLIKSGSLYGDVYIAKFSANGNWAWAKSAGGTNMEFAYSIAADASGNSYVVGNFDSPSITFGSTTLTHASSSYRNMFIVKYDSNGNALWAKSPETRSQPNSIVIDASGNSYVVGYFGGSTITFGSTTLTNAGSNNMFIVKYDISGNVLWAKSAGGSSNDFAYSVAYVASGNILVAGSFQSPALTFGSTTLTNTTTNGNSDMFIAKLNSATGVESLENTDGVNIYPNPSTGKYIIEMENVKGLVGEGMIEIYNVMGEIIYNSTFQQLNNTTIDISEKPNGIYFLSIISDQGKRTIKILKY